MAPMGANYDEPLTPAGRLFLRPELDTIIHCAIGVQNYMDISSIKSTVASSLMAQHPRFRSLLVVDKNGVEHWRPTNIDIDRHIILVGKDEHNTRNNDDNDDELSNFKVVNDYIADLSVSTPLSTDKPLWEIHILWAQKCAVFRIHHALGDGISLMSLFLANCRKVNDPTAVPSIIEAAPPKNKKRNLVEAFVGILKMVLFSLIFCLEFTLRGMWVKDQKTGIEGGDGVELWPRKMATARFLIEDMKVVKGAVSNATINDVLFGVISAGLSRYLDHRSTKSLKDGTQITGVAMVNLRPQPGLQELSEMMKRNSSSRWGNKFGMLLLPVYYRRDTNNPLQYVRQAKAMIDRKKRSCEAHFSYKVGDLIMSLFGPKLATLLNIRVLCNTTFTISNVVGPKEKISIAGNPITSIRVNTSSIPHALTMHMASYAGRADMQILVAKDIIPDPEFLAKCFEDVLLEMKKAVVAAK